MKDYYGIFQDGTKINSINISGIKDVPRVKYLFRRELQGKYGQWDMFKYFAIDQEDNQRIIRVGDFELVDIGSEKVVGNSKINRSLTIYDRRTKLHRIKYSTANGIDFVTEDLLPLLNKLNELGSWEMYEKSFEVEKLREENMSLQNEVDQLKKQLEEALNTNKEHKS